MATGESSGRFVRRPEEARRIGRGDDFAGDAWADTQTGALRWVAVDFDPNTGTQTRPHDAGLTPFGSLG